MKLASTAKVKQFENSNKLGTDLMAFWSEMCLTHPGMARLGSSPELLVRRQQFSSPVSDGQFTYRCSVWKEECGSLLTGPLSDRSRNSTSIAKER
jgi:hypothetical protein